MLVEEQSLLGDIAEKVKEGQRLDKEDGLRLLKTTNLLEIGRLADRVRQDKVGDIVTYVGNKHICFTNICKNTCRYCIFRKSGNDSEAFTLSLDEIEAQAEDLSTKHVPEILFYGAINPSLSLEFFEEALTRIRSKIPKIHILGFSPIEIDYFALTERISIKEVLERLKAKGLTAITGGGGEIFSPRVREQLNCPQKISSERWLEIMETAHSIEVYSNAAMLYGFTETLEERIDHIIKIRDLQDKTGGFTHFLPFAFAWEGFQKPTGYDDLKMLATARLMLDNFKHIRAYWCHLGKKLAQVSLSFGVDDLNGITQKGRIIHCSGVVPSRLSTAEDMIKLIKNAGRIPAERDVLFNIIN